MHAHVRVRACVCVCVIVCVCTIDQNIIIMKYTDIQRSEHVACIQGRKPLWFWTALCLLSDAVWGDVPNIAKQ